jgi:hypothetical protein
MAISYNPAQRAAANAGASKDAIDKLKAKPPTPKVASNVAQAAATSAGASADAIAQVAQTSPEQVVAPPVGDPLTGTNSPPPNQMTHHAQLPTVPSPETNPPIANNPADLARINAENKLKSDAVARKAGITGHAEGGVQPTTPPAVTPSMIPPAAGTGSTDATGDGVFRSKMPTDKKIFKPTDATDGTGKSNIDGGVSRSYPESSSGGGAGGRTFDPKPFTDEGKNVYFDQLKDNTFNYDPSTDQSYWKAAANAENAIIQSIIGRGGLYSSVAQSAVSAKLMDLSIEFEKVAYDKFTSERNHLFQMAQFEQQRLQNAWDQKFNERQFDAQQKANAWDQQFKERQFDDQQKAREWDQQFNERQFDAQQDAIAWDQQFKDMQFQYQLEKDSWARKQQIAASGNAAQQLAYQKEAEKANAKNDAQIKQAKKLIQKNQNDVNAHNEMVNYWAAKGTADARVAEFFANYGVVPGMNINDPYVDEIILQAENKLRDEAKAIALQIETLQQEELAADYLNTYMQPVTNSSSPAIATPAAQQSSYYEEFTSYLTEDNAKSVYQDLIKNQTKWIELFGASNYKRAIQDAGAYLKGIEKNDRWSGFKD